MLDSGIAKLSRGAGPVIAEGALGAVSIAAYDTDTCWHTVAVIRTLSGKMYSRSIRSSAAKGAVARNVDRGV